MSDKQSGKIEGFEAALKKRSEQVRAWTIALMKYVPLPAPEVLNWWVSRPQAFRTVVDELQTIPPYERPLNVWVTCSSGVHQSLFLDFLKWVKGVTLIERPGRDPVHLVVTDHFYGELREMHQSSDTHFAFYACRGMNDIRLSHLSQERPLDDLFKLIWHLSTKV